MSGHHIAAWHRGLAPPGMPGGVTRRALALGAAGIATLGVVPVRAQDVMGSTGIRGAGSTFAYPVISKWSREYRLAQTGSGSFAAPNSGLDDPPASSALDYEPVGSLAGTLRVREGAVDFAASDVPLGSDVLAKLGLAQFPVVIGGVAVVVNIDGIASHSIRFTGPLLADIFLGRIVKWSDPAIQSLNPELKLPDATIAVVRRSDGSGTTFNFTDYLSKASAAWKEKVGADLTVAWPTGIGAKGNTGVAERVKQTKHSIGYVEYSVAVQAKLALARLRNRAGQFVQAEASSFQAAAASADWAATRDFHLLLNDAPGEKAYPVVATVFVLMPKAAAPKRSAQVLDFFRWSLEQGARDAAQLGYVPLPDALVGQIKAYWSSTLKVA